MDNIYRLKKVSKLEKLAEASTQIVEKPAFENWKIL